MMKKTMAHTLRRFRMIISYFSHSVVSTLIDVALVWLLLRITSIHLVTANTVGVISGFSVGFFLDVRRTFSSRYSLLTFMVYLGTFLLGLVIADWLIVSCYNMVIPYTSTDSAFLISKGASVIIPFFGLYFLRKYLYKAAQRYEKRNTDE